MHATAGVPLARPMHERFQTTAGRIATLASTRRASIVVALAPTACHRLLEAGHLRAFPLFDGSTIEAPIAADSKAREASLPEEAVDSRRMDAQVLGEFLNRKDIVPRGIRLGRTV